MFKKNPNKEQELSNRELRTLLVAVRRHRIEAAKDLVEANEEIEKLKAESAQLQAQLEAFRWIPVEERLPEEMAWYRVYIQSERQAYQMDAIYSKTQGGWLECGGGNIPDVSYWMPLPDDPPQQEEE